MKTDKMEYDLEVIIKQLEQKDTQSEAYNAVRLKRALRYCKEAKIALEKANGYLNPDDCQYLME